MMMSCEQQHTCNGRTCTAAFLHVDSNRAAVAHLLHHCPSIDGARAVFVWIIVFPILNHKCSLAQLVSLHIEQHNSCQCSRTCAVHLYITSQLSALRNACKDLLPCSYFCSSILTWETMLLMGMLPTKWGFAAEVCSTCPPHSTICMTAH